MVDVFIADLKDSIKEAKLTPSGKGTMVALYGMCIHSTIRSCKLIHDAQDLESPALWVLLWWDN